MPFELPSVPVPHAGFIKHLADNPSVSLRELIRPYNDYEARLREGYAQHRQHPAIQDPHVNVVPIFAGFEKTLTTRARAPATDPEADKYIMPLEDDVRRKQGEPAISNSLKEFRNNFNLFSEQSLIDMDWNNVVAAGSSVVTSMLPVPEEHRASKRALREYYHQKLAPSSDVDLFIWGLDEAAAIKKIAQIEECVRNSILAETVTIRTKAAITIASQYPTRHIQIVLRLYKSVSEILTGFDVDSSCFAYDGSQVYSTPRGVTSFCSQTNTVDLSRRSPSYESRLAKYAHRGFEIYCADLDRRRIDPTVYDRSFVRTMGLARLLVLERLPTEADRDRYLNQRRQERGRPPLDTWRNRKRQLPGNMKDKDPEDVPEWDFEADVSNYHTFTVPYGPKYHARKIERLLFIKDMLLNAEWNKRKERTVDLHRHPCFIGDVASIIHDCCGECPEPKSDEELAVAEEECNVYVQGDLTFVKDDPGRQTIGSFNPLTAEDWTDMAYLGNTQALAGYIIDGDLDAVRTWCAQGENDVNKRDHTGRTPLQLAVLCNQVEAVKVLINTGARITARIADGFTALHMAAAVGSTDIIRLLSQKSDANEEEEARKDEARKAERKAAGLQSDTQMTDDANANAKASQVSQKDSNGELDSDAEMIDAESTEQDETMTQGSFVKIESDKDGATTTEDDSWGPDVYNANVLAWDTPVSPLHVAILCGHIEAVDTLVNDFGADVLLPVKLKHSYNSEVRTVILNLALASRMPDSQSTGLVQKLVGLGAKPSQSDIHEVSAFHGAVILENVTALKAMLETDEPAALIALNHLALEGGSYSGHSITSPLLSAIRRGNESLAKTLLELDARPSVSFEDFREVMLRARERRNNHWSRDYGLGDEYMRKQYLTRCEQPIMAAARSGLTETVRHLLDRGADINTHCTNGGRLLNKDHSYSPGKTILDVFQARAKEAQYQLECLKPQQAVLPGIKPLDEYLAGLEPGSYQYTLKKRQAELAIECASLIRSEVAGLIENYNSEEKKNERAWLEQTLVRLRQFVAELEARGAKGFYSLYPDAARPEQNSWQQQQQNISDQKRKHDEMEASPVYEPSIHINDQRTTDIRKENYLKLFEAAWKGDIDTVKSLTLRKIEDAQGKQLDPIPIATSDGYGLNPFSIAVYRGHTQLAQVVLDITAAQYQAPNAAEEPKRRFRIRGQEARDGEDYEDEMSEEGYHDEIPIESEIVDGDVTIDDLAQLGPAVASSVKPIEVFNWQSAAWLVGELERPFEQERQKYDAKYKVAASCDSYSGRLAGSYPVQNHVSPHDHLAATVNSNLQGNGISLLRSSIIKGDVDMIRLLLQISRRLVQSERPSTDEQTARICAWDAAELEGALNLAIRRGKIDIAEILITECGAGMPIVDMLKDVEVPEEEQEKSKYYQGLKLYGKHKKAWAAQAAGSAPQSPDNWRNRSPAPFLKAVYLESRKNMEFWQSDSCVRLYCLFGERHQHLKEVQRISRKHGGWNHAVTEWLGLRRELSLHCAVMRGARASQRAEVIDTTKYILSTVPNSLETKSLTGRDPLWLAFYYRQVNNARLFIEAGADQNTRDHGGMNIMHAMLSQGLPQKEEEAAEVVDKMEQLLQLVDARVLPALFTDRCSFGPTGLTPFAYWMQSTQSNSKAFELLDKWMPAEVYSMFDGSGQTPTHKVLLDGAGSNLPPLLKPILDAHPELIEVENGFGQTLLDQARVFYLRLQTSNAPSALGENRYMHANFHRSNESKKPSAPREHGFNGDKKSQIVAYNFLQLKVQEYEMQHGPGSLRRKMISVREASEVAKRLAETQQATNSPHRMSRRHRRAQWEQSNNEPHDEVDRWHGEHGTKRQFGGPAPRKALSSMQG